VRRLLWNGEKGGLCETSQPSFITPGSSLPAVLLRTVTLTLAPGVKRKSSPFSSGQRVLDTHLVVEMIRPVDGDLCFFRFVGKGGFYDLPA
jgi:hypothetical protein